MLFVVAIAGAFLASGTAQAADRMVVNVKGDRELQETAFSVEILSDDGEDVTDQTATLVIRQDGEEILSRIVDPEVRFRWSCSNIGSYQWEVTASRPNGSTHFKEGTFEVPGPCSQSSVLLRRATVLRYVSNDLRDPQVVVERECQAASKVVGGRARVWRCAAAWITDGSNVCLAAYEIRRVRTVRFGLSKSRWRARRVTQIRCERF